MSSATVSSSPSASAGGERSITIRGLTRRFGSKTALHPLDLAIAAGPDQQEGSVVGLLGPNGSGKSTLMRILTGLVRPDKGAATVAGIELAGDATEIRRRVTYSPGELHLYSELKGAEHIEWFLRGRDARAKERGLALARELGLPLERRVRGYSHGMKRQLVFAAAMAPDVAIRILDEPTDGLDPTKRSEVLDRLASDARSGVTVLLSSHHFGEVDRTCDRLVFLNEGRLVADETAEAVRERAARVVHLVYEDEAQVERAERALRLPAVESLQRSGQRLSLVLVDRDPRPFLGALAALGDLPSPTSIEHGRLSLRELYRALYGVEGT